MRLGYSVHALACALATPSRPSRAPVHGQHQREAIAGVVGAAALSTRLPRAEDHGYILLCPDCGPLGPYKRWGRWHDLAKALRESRHEVRWCCAEDGGLPELIGAVAHASLVIALDSGPAHLADLLGVPVIGLYAATSTTSYGPYCDRALCVDKHREAWALCMVGDYDSSRHIHDPRAMELIGVDDVLARVHEWAGLRRAA